MEENSVKLVGAEKYDIPTSDTVKIEYPSVEVPRTFVQEQPIYNRDFEAFKKSALALSEIKGRNDEDLLKGGIHNAIASIDKSLDGVPFEHAMLLFFGKEISLNDAVQYFEDIYNLTENTDQNSIRDFLNLPEEKQNEVVRAKSPDAKITTTKYQAGATAPLLLEEDNPNFDIKKAKEEHIQSLAERNVYGAYVYCKEHFGSDTMTDAMEFIRADNWRSDIANLYLEKLQSMSPDKARDFISAVSILRPQEDGGFFKRVFTQLGERATDTWENIKNLVWLDGSTINPDSVYAEFRGAFDADGNPTEVFKKLREKAGEYSDGKGYATLNTPLGAFGGAELKYNNMYSDSDLKKMYEEGEKRFESRKLFRHMRALKSANFDYSKISSGEKLFEDVFITGIDMLKYLAAGAVAGSATGNPYMGVAASMSLMFAEEASGMYDSLVFEGEMPLDKAAVYSVLYGATASALEQFQITRFSKTLKGTSYLLKGNPLEKTFKGYLKHDLKELPKTYLREGGAETFTEFAQNLADYATKKWVTDHENASFDEKELWDNFANDFVETAKVMPTLMALTSVIGFGVNANRRRIESGGSLKGFFSVSEAVNNHIRTKSAIAQLDKMDEELKRSAERTGDKYGEDFVGSYLGASESQRLSMIEGRFDSQEDLDGFLNDIEILENEQLARSKMQETANKKMAEQIAAVHRKNEVEAASLENDFQKIDAFKDENGKRSVIEAFLDKYGGREDVVFVNSAEDLDGIFSPEESKEIIEDIRRKGVYDHKNGKIYLFEPHFKDGVEAFRTLVHERLHWMADKIRQDPSFNGMLNRVLNIMGGADALKHNLENEYSGSKDLDLAEEYIARVCERVALKEVLDENSRSVFKTFKSWIKRIFTAENTFVDIQDREVAEIAKTLFKRANRETQKLSSSEWSATTPEENGVEVGGKYAVLDASEIITSTDAGYDDTLQPRNRDRRGSIEQVSKIATHLNPKRLDSSETTDDGAPIIDEKGQVLSGNGRTLAIREAYANNPERGSDYRNYVLGRAKQMGLDVPSGIKNPVLVRRIENSGGMSLQEFAARSNKQKVASMSNAETAVADARRILELGSDGGRILDLFFPSDKGDVLSESNTEFINAFLEAVGGREQYIDKNGRIKPNLAPRIRAAVLAAMLDPNKRDVIENLLDNPEGWSGLIRGLIGCAANLGKLAGNADYDLSSELSQAVELYVNLRREGRTYQDYVSQIEMFELPPSAEVSFLMELFEANTKTPTGISGVLNEYYNLVKNIDTTSVDMFGEGNPPKIAELQEAFKRYGGTEHKSDVSWSIRKSDAERFAYELEEYIKGNLDNRHIFRLGTTPEVMRLVGAKDLPITMQVKTLSKKLAQHEELNVNDLKTLPSELADPIAIFQSQTRDNSVVVLTDIKTSKGNVIAAVHFNKFDVNGIEINGIQSVHGRPNGQIVNFIQNGMTLYVNTRKAPSWMRLPLVQFHGRNLNKNVLYGGKIFTESDLSQAEKENIFELRQKSPRFKYSVRDNRSAEELEALNNKHLELYTRYKGGDKTAYTEAAELVRREVERKGHAVKVYHGTGSNGFNVADATGKNLHYGEGQQTHGVGLYIAVSRDVADKYRENAQKEERYEITKNGKPFNLEKELGISENDVVWVEKAIDGILYENDRIYGDAESAVMAYMSQLDENMENGEDVFESKKLKEAADYFYGYILDNEIDSLDEFYSRAVHGDGRLFDWFTNLNDGNTIDEDLRISGQSAIFRKLQDAWENDIRPYFEGKNNRDLLYGANDCFNPEYNDNPASYVEYGQRLLGVEKFREIMLKHGIKGISYDGRQDGRCYVSFEGGSAVKLQDPFTFDDNGELIPLSERFDSTNPDMRWSVRDTPKEFKETINSIVSEIDKIKKNNLPTDTKSLEKRYAKYGNDGNRILDLKVAKLNDKQAEYFGLEDKYIYTSLFDILNHHFNHHLELNETAYFNLPKTIAEAIIVAGGSIKGSYIFGVKLDNWYVSTSFIISNSNKAVLYKNFYITNKPEKVFKKNKIIKELTSWEDWQSSIHPTSNRSKGSASNISALQDINSVSLQSPKSSENQEKNPSNLKYLLRQERASNPLTWASIVLAKEALLGRNITQAKLEKLLPPSEGFDGSNYEYVKDRAIRIAETCRAKKYNAKKDLDQAVQLAESDYHWQTEMVDKIYSSFRKDGEEYGMAKVKVAQWLKDQKLKKLKDIKGYEESDFNADLTASILQAMEKEPERKKPEESFEESEEGLDDISIDGVDGEFSEASKPKLNKNIRDVISTIKREVLRRSRLADDKEGVMREKYRKTLVNILSASAKELAYGIERERILSKISELEKANYAVITIKDGERAGQKIDNFTLRAEHIALRIFNRGVRDTKNALLEKLNKALKNVKTPKRVMRDDKRKMSGKAQERAKRIKNIADMSVSEIDEEIEKTTDAINKADSKAAEEYEAKLIDAVSYLEDLQRFGAFKEKSRADMAEAVDWIENYLESETEHHAEKVEKLKADAAERRQVFIDAINEITRNANFDGNLRKGFRSLINASLTFKDLLLTLGRSATGEKRRAFENLVNSMASDCYAATSQKENEILDLQSEFQSAIEKIYKMPARDALKRLLGRNEKLQKFSVQAKPMSVQIALQRLSMSEQEHYKQNVYIHCIGKSKEYVDLERAIDKIKLSGLGSYEKEMSKQSLAFLEKQRDAIVNQSVDAYAQELRAALSKEDLELLEWFRDFYKRERGSLSNANEAITGLGIPEVDPNYTPMKMLREGGTNEKIQVVAIVPKSLSPRVSNSLDMDESVGIVDIWNKRVAENAHYKAFSQLNIEWRGIFAHADFHAAVNLKLGKDTLNQLLDFFNDIMSVRLQNQMNIGIIDKANGLYAISALGFNLGSAWRQTTSIPAFMNFMGMGDFIKYTKEGIIPAHLTAASGGKLAGKIGNPEARQAVKEILNSKNAKRRMQKGNNQVLVEALDNIEDNKFWAWYKRNALVLNKWGDMVPILTVGQGFYRAKTKEYAKTMPLDKAKEKAMNEMWMIAEMSQQSSSVMNAPVWTRRGGSIAKATALFTSQPQLMVSREVEAFNRFNAVREKYKKNPKDKEIMEEYLKARRELAKVVFVNHVLVQGGYMLATLIWKAILGDDWDEGDALALLGETIAGPMGGLIVFGRFAAAFYSKYAVSTMPLEGFGRTIANSVELVQDLITLEWEDVAKDLDKIGKNLFAPYREASKIYKNATDNKEGVVW